MELFFSLLLVVREIFFNSLEESGKVKVKAMNLIFVLDSYSAEVNNRKDFYLAI